MEGNPVNHKRARWRGLSELPLMVYQRGEVTFQPAIDSKDKSQKSNATRQGGLSKCLLGALECICHYSLRSSFMSSGNSNEQPSSLQSNILTSSGLQSNSLPSSSLQSNSLPSSIVQPINFPFDGPYDTSLQFHGIADASFFGNSQLGQALSAVVGRLEPDEPKAQFLLSVSKLARDKTHWTVGLEPGNQGKVFKTATFLWSQWSKTSKRPNKQPDREQKTRLVHFSGAVYKSHHHLRSQGKRKKLNSQEYVLWLKRKPGPLADVMDDLHMMYFASG